MTSAGAIVGESGPGGADVGGMPSHVSDPSIILWSVMDPAGFEYP